MRTFIALMMFCCFANPAFAQFEIAEQKTKGPVYGETRTAHWQIGTKIEAIRGPAIGLYMTIPIPTDWPEQQVRIVEEDISRNCGKVTYRMVDGGVKQMIVSVPRVAHGDTAHALITLEVVTASMKPPADTSVLSIPKKSPRAILKNLGASPYINSRHSSVRKIAKQLAKENEEKSDWEKVEAIYDWTRENIELDSGDKLIGALQAIRNKKGIAEDRNNVFVALCRASKVPCRTVWISGHFYAEFYMLDDEKKGHWIPCELVGSRNFGGVDNPKPILQKGDNIRVPEYKEPQRFVAEFLKGKKSGARPKVSFIRELKSSK